MFCFLVVEVEGCPHRFCSAELWLPSKELIIYGCNVLAQHPFHCQPGSISMHHCKVASIRILSGDGGWQVRDVDVEEKRCQDEFLWDVILEASSPAPFVFSCGKGKIAIANHPNDHPDHVSSRWQSQQLASEAAMPCSVIDQYEIDKHRSGLLLSRKAIFVVVCQQGDLVYGRPPVSKSRLLQWEQWVDDSFETMRL